MSGGRATRKRRPANARPDLWKSASAKRCAPGRAAEHLCGQRKLGVSTSPRHAPVSRPWGSNHATRRRVGAALEALRPGTQGNRKP